MNKNINIFCNSSFIPCIRFSDTLCLKLEQRQDLTYFISGKSSGVERTYRLPRAEFWEDLALQFYMGSQVMHGAEVGEGWCMGGALLPAARSRKASPTLARFAARREARPQDTGL